MSFISYRYPDARILIFSKAPLAGRAKTRLIPVLGEQGAADFSECLIRHVVEKAVRSQLCPVQLWCEPNCDQALFQELHDVYRVELKQQQGGDLGTRMAFALEENLVNHHVSVLIGSDCPAITAGYLQQALQMLSTTSSCVLGPAEDGGYVLVGQALLHTAMFKNINWGTSDVLEQTRQRLDASGRRWFELATLWDVDRPEDVVRARDLLEELPAEAI